MNIRKRFTDYTLLDQKLFEIAGAIETNLIKFINPQNVESEKNRFFETINKNEEYQPNFTYAPRTMNASYFVTDSRMNTFRNELKEMLNEIGADELGVVFESEILDLIEKIDIIKSIGSENFSGNTESYYGGIDKKTLSLAKKEILLNPLIKETPIHFSDALKEINNFLKQKKLNYKIIIREPAGARFAVINSRREILINKDTIFSKEMVQRLIAHEIETHVYRYENGLIQPYKLLAHGFSRETTQTEEGLAAIIEKIKGVSSPAQIKEYAGRVVAISEAEKNNFLETFNEMSKYFDEENAFRLTLRAKRGIKDQTKKGAFYKDALYFKGMLKVEEFLKNHKLEELYLGKYAIEDILLVKNIPGIKQPKHLPKI